MYTGSPTADGHALNRFTGDVRYATSTQGHNADNAVRYNAVQSLSEVEKTQARNNVGFGNAATANSNVVMGGTANTSPTLKPITDFFVPLPSSPVQFQYIWSGTQAQYDSAVLAGTIPANTFIAIHEN